MSPVITNYKIIEKSVREDKDITNIDTWNVSGVHNIFKLEMGKILDLFRSNQNDQKNWIIWYLQKLAPDAVIRDINIIEAFHAVKISEKNYIIDAAHPYKTDEVPEVGYFYLEVNGNNIIGNDVIGISYILVEQTK
ncbi:hypothetical protein [Spiroplasma syrphidicola]|uniref:hypothetical protein n=1 Tax=Spiroplasma syrphidicola TaxID=216945 RepID=UPI0003A3000B|nr:hypothetical protein [Spiroplasma syrphidicola]